MLAVDSSVGLHVQGEAGEVWLDVMMNPAIWDDDEYPMFPEETDHTAFFLNTNGQLVVMGNVDMGEGRETAWIDLDHPPVEADAWFRLTCAIAHKPDGAHNYFRIFVDGDPVQHAMAEPVPGEGGPDGVWFRCATDDADAFPGLTWHGVGYLDDLAITTDGRLEPTLPLTVESDYGEAWPGVGETWWHPGDGIAATVQPTDADTAEGRQCIGWLGNGSVPSNGPVASVAFDIDEASTLTWLWGTNVQYTLTVVNGTGQGTYAVDTVVAVVADEAPVGQTFSHWSVEPEDAELGVAFDESQPETTVIMPPHGVTLTAVYRDEGVEIVPIGEFEWSTGNVYLLDGRHGLHIMARSGGSVRMDESGDVHLAYGHYDTIRYAVSHAGGTISTALVDTVVKRNVRPGLARNDNGYYIVTDEWERRPTYHSYSDNRLYHKPLGGAWSKLQDILIDVHYEAGGAKDAAFDIQADPNGNLRIQFLRHGWWSYGYAKRERVLDRHTHVLGPLSDISTRVASHPDHGRNNEFNGLFYLTDENAMVMPLMDGVSRTVFLADTPPDTFEGWTDRGDIIALSGEAHGGGIWQESNGDIHAAMRLYPANRVFYSRNWGAPVEVSDLPARATDVAVHNGRVYVLIQHLHQESNHAAGNLYMVSKPLNGGEWTPAQQVTFETTDYRDHMTGQFFFARPFGFREDAARLCFAYTAHDGTVSGNDYLGAHIRVVEVREGGEALSHTVSFDLDGKGQRIGGGELVQQVPHGQAAVAPEVAAHAGWNFLGWDRAFDNVTNDLTVTAWFEPGTYTLTVASAHGEPDPAVGIHTNLYGTPLTNMVDAVVIDGGTQYVNTGWTLDGHEPAAGASNQFTMTVTNDAVLTWHWATNYWLEATAGTGGSVDVSNQWVAAGGELVISATPDGNHYFAEWIGDTDGCPIDGNEIRAIMDRPRAITAVFAIDTYTLTYHAGTGGSIDGESPQTVAYGESGTAVSAVADPGYRFTQWSDGLTDNPRQDVNVTNDVTVTAWFSPSGKVIHIYYLSNQTGSANLFKGQLVDDEIVDSVQKTFYGIGERVAAYDVCRSTGRIAYVLAQRSSNGDLYLLDASDGTPALVPNQPVGGIGSLVKWSPDGSRLLFSLAAEQHHHNMVIAAMRPDGSDYEVIINSTQPMDRNCHKNSVLWVDEGMYLGVTPQWAAHATDHDLWLRDNDGTFARLTSTATIGEAHAFLSPDGQTLVFQTLDNAQRNGLRTMPKSGGDQAVVIPHSTSHRCYPNGWLDDQSIVYSFRENATGATYDLYVVDRNGGNIRNISNRPDDDIVNAVIIESSAIPSAAEGWRYPRMDRIGHASLVQGSTVRTGNDLSVLRAIDEVGSVLTGDVDGDGLLDIVTVSGSTLRIYAGDGTLKRTIDLPRPSFLGMIEDADGDGVLDIFLGGSGSGFAAYIYKGDGTHLKTFVGQHAGSHGDVDIRPIALANGKVLVGYNAGFARTPRGFAAFDYETTEELWYYQVGPRHTGNPSVTDMDGNGLLDLLMGSFTPHNGASGNDTTDSDMYVIVVDETGGRRLTQKYTSPSKGHALHVFADLTGNGQHEIVGFKGHDPRYYPGRARIHVFGQDGAVLHTFDGPRNESWSYAIGDLDNNGSLEIVAAPTRSTDKVYVLDPGLNLLRETEIDGRVQLLADLTGDGSKEIVLLSSTGWLTVLDRNLATLAGMQVGVGSGQVIASDVTGDGRVELLCRTDRLYIVGFDEPGIEHDITATADVGGSIAPSGTVSVAHGADATFAIAADAGYVVNDVLINGVSIGATNQYTFANVETGGQTIEAYFSESGNWTFMVVDLSEGPEAEHYPVGYYDAVPSGGWSDAYKTEKLVLRRIPAGTFMMGSPTNELGRSGNEAQREVTLTQDYFIGVFPVTQRQWERVMGEWPAYFENPDDRDTRPLESRTWNEIRGGAWPGRPYGVGMPAGDTFVARMRERTGVAAFDLPTEAQWEYAGRAGRATALNSGRDLTSPHACPNVAQVGRYWHNGGSAYTRHGAADVGTAGVGAYRPNAWGLYDIHGNVWEWCLDWYALDAPGAVDPGGPGIGAERLARGGGWSSEAWQVRAATRQKAWPGARYGSFGFRLAGALPGVHVRNLHAEPVDFDAVTLHGELMAAGPLSGADVSIFWGETDGGTNPDDWAHVERLGERAIGAFAATVDGLIPDQAYYFRAFASNAFDTAWAPTSLPFMTSMRDGVVMLDPLDQVYDGTPRVVDATTVPADLRVTVTYDGGTNAPVNAGHYAVMGWIIEPGWQGVATGLLTVARAEQTIAFAPLDDALATDTVALSATASSGLPVGFTVVSGPAVLSDGTNLTFTGSGEVRVEASQPGDENWHPAASVIRTLRVSRAPASVILRHLQG